MAAHFNVPGLAYLDAPRSTSTSINPPGSSTASRSGAGGASAWVFSQSPSLLWGSPSTPISASGPSGIPGDGENSSPACNSASASSPAVALGLTSPSSSLIPFNFWNALPTYLDFLVCHPHLGYYQGSCMGCLHLLQGTLAKRKGISLSGASTPNGKYSWRLVKGR